MELNERPIIGIVSQRMLEKPPDSTPIPNFAEVKASYVKWIESAGARVVPVLINQSGEYYDNLYKALNGLILPGGRQGTESLLDSPTCKVAKYFYERSIEEFDNNGDYFPIWGTCQGFQILSALTAKKNLLETTKGTYGRHFPLHLHESHKDSRLFGTDSMSPEILDIITTENVTYNSNSWSITQKSFSSNDDLKKFYRILATNKDSDGLEYVTTMEAYRYPMYATIWHPEANSYQWTLYEPIPHSINAVRMSQHLANFFVNEVRKNHHKFSSIEEETRNLIYNYSPVNRGDIFDGKQYYLFDI